MYFKEFKAVSMVISLIHRTALWGSLNCQWVLFLKHIVFWDENGSNIDLSKWTLCEYHLQSIASSALRCLCWVCWGTLYQLYWGTHPTSRNYFLLESSALCKTEKTARNNKPKTHTEGKRGDKPNISLRQQYSLILQLCKPSYICRTHFACSLNFSPLSLRISKPASHCFYSQHSSYTFVLQFDFY